MKQLHKMELGTEALDLLFEVTVLLHQDATTGLARDGLTPSRATVLWYLRSSGPSLQRELAEAMNVSPRNITGLVDALVSTGFVTREPHPTDRRATLVTLTRRGSGVVKRLERQQEEFVTALFGDTPSKQLDAFVSYLRAVVERLHDLGLEQDMSDR